MEGQGHRPLLVNWHHHCGPSSLGGARVYYYAFHIRDGEDMHYRDSNAVVSIFA